MSDKKTYYIKKEDCRDIGWAYEIDGKDYDGNLIIDVDKTIVIKGYQIVEGYQDVKRKKITGHCKYIVSYDKEEIHIGCKSKNTKDWDDFFASEEIYDTERNTLAFNQIHKTYLMAKAAQSIDEGLAS